MNALARRARRRWLLRAVASPIGWSVGAPLAGLAAGEAAAAVAYPAVRTGEPLVFPRDHGAHPDYRTEWWYVTGWLERSDHRPLGFQVTFFRSRPGIAEDLPVASAARQIIFAHAALSLPEHGRLLHDQRAARVAFGLARAGEATMDVALDDWSLVMDARGRFTARIRAREFRFDLSFVPRIAPVLQGEEGVSRKGPRPSQASYYYSLPQVSVQGRVELLAAAGNGLSDLMGQGKRAQSVTGRAWFDHEWSSEYMAPSVVGWDWAGINLRDGGALMVFRMRDADGGVVWAGGSLRRSDGTEQQFEPGEVRFVTLRTWQSPRTGAWFPVQMQVEVPGLTLALRPLIDDQELDARHGVGAVYWEGAVRAHGRTGSLLGQGYLELTGYAGRLQM